MFPQTSNLVDMFPLTRTLETIGKNINPVASTHVETIALIERVSNRKPDKVVEIGVDVEDYYKIKNE